MAEILKNFFSTNEISVEQILNNLLNSDKNLALKTEINNPLRLAKLMTFANYLRSQKYVKSYKLIKGFIESYLTYMVSNKRKSRNEVIQALTSLVDKSNLNPNQDTVIK